jgi:hypothetical protein
MKHAAPRLPQNRVIYNGETGVAEVEALEWVQAARKHLGVDVGKPCVAVYWMGRANPSIGNRNLHFYALASELRRSGMTEGQACQSMRGYFLRRQAIYDEPGADGRPFTWAEGEHGIQSAYRSSAVKSYGCHSGMWVDTCVGIENCLFHKQLIGGHLQSPQAARATLMQWIAMPGLLTGNAVRVYLALDHIEHKRHLKAGTTIYASWSEIGGMAGILRPNVGRALESLFWSGLISYKKGMARERGTASEIRRVLPMPLPPVKQTIPPD